MGDIGFPTDDGGLLRAADRLCERRSLPEAGYERLVAERTPELAAELARRARAECERVYGDEVFTRGLIEFTNHCKNDCLYCGIRRSNGGCRRYRLGREDILRCASEGYDLGFRTFVLQGGEDSAITDEWLCETVGAIKRAHPDCAVTLSVGERSRESYARLREAGADRYLLRHETASPAHYRALHPPEMSFENRMRCLRDLRELGYAVGIGFMVGSPFQTPADLARDLKFIEEFRPEMCGIGPFVPHHATPFARHAGGTAELTCYLLSLIRLIQPNILLPATTALGTIDPGGREKGILAGANVVMPNLSPVEVRADYELYDDKICTGEEAAECRGCLGARMLSIGRRIVVDRGDPAHDEAHRSPTVTEGAGVVAGMNETPSGERVHVGFFGVRNAGKSSLVNAVIGQDLAVVSDAPGTTTDPVRKAMELAPVGPVLVIDTPGIDDAGDLGSLRVAQAQRVLDSVDVAVLAVDPARGMGAAERELIGLFRQRDIPHLMVWTKADLGFSVKTDAAHLAVSAQTGAGVEELKTAIARLAADAGPVRVLVSDLIAPGDVVVLVMPIDSSAPKGRVILPQQQVIRDVVEAGASACAATPEGLPALLAALARPPRLVVTDSQAFGVVARIVPDDVPLTSFSILMARYKGTLDAQIAAVSAIGELRDGDHVLVSEGCTHHRQCEDIGTVKIPRCIRRISGAEPQFEFTSGGEFPRDLSPYRVVVHCGGCMLNAREMESRLRRAQEQGVPFANYGLVIAEANGVLSRALAPLT